MYRRLASLLILLTTALAMAGSPVFAQINPFKGWGVDLSSGDVELLKAAAAARLYGSDAARVGDVERWANTGSGNSGAVALIEIFSVDEMSCRKLRHVVKIEGAADMKSVFVSRCQIPNGEWKIYHK